MKILVVGGVARSLVNFRGALLRRLVLSGHDVIAASAPGSDDVTSELGAMQVRFYPIPLLRARISPLADVKAFISLLFLIRREKPDFIFAYTAKPVVYSGFAALLRRRIKIYSLISGLGYSFGNGSFNQIIIGNIVKRLYRFSLLNSAGIFFQNTDDRDEFYRYDLLRKNCPVTVINGSGVDLQKFTVTPLPGGVSFLLIARLLIDKGIREYVAAARVLRKRYPHVNFRLAGYLDVNPSSISSGELQGWQVEGVIEYLGELSDVRPALDAAMVYVLPSYREGTPRTVLEAMAMGRPVITSDAPGCRETVVPGENGFLVPVRSVEALVAAMERFIHEPELAVAMGKASRRIARDKYDVHKVNAVIIQAMGLNSVSSPL